MNTELDKELIYKEYKDKITGYVTSKVFDHSKVEDIVSDVFVKIYKNLDKYDPEKAALSTWIYTVTSRVVLDYFRSYKQFDEISEITPSTDNIEESYLQAESLSQLAAALKKLPERERDLIILHYYKNISLKDIAEKMNLSYITIKVSHKKALTLLKEYLG